MPDPVLRLGDDYFFTGKHVDGRREIQSRNPMWVRVFGILLETEAGTTSDGGSVPSVADDFFGFDPLRIEYLYAAWWHDHIYRTQSHSKWLADLIFFALQWRTGRHLKHNVFRTLYFSTITYLSVALFGPRYKIEQA